jgi:hypothetical protein
MVNRPLIIFGIVLLGGTLCLCALCPIALGLPVLFAQTGGIPPLPPVPGVPPVPPSPLALVLLACCCPLCLVPLLGLFFFVLGWLVSCRGLNLGAFGDCIASIFNTTKTQGTTNLKSDQKSSPVSAKVTANTTDIQAKPQAEAKDVPSPESKPSDE